MHAQYSSVDPRNGNIKWDGPLAITESNHDHMPPRTDAYLPGTEKGHNNACSLGGPNDITNVFPEYYDLNHHGIYSLERGERTALQSGATIDSVKLAVVDGKSGEMPHVIMISDSVQYPNGHTDIIHNSFTNEPYAYQEALNAYTASLPGNFEAPNPGDELRGSMSTDQYAQLMTETDATLPGIAADYKEADFSGLPVSLSASPENAADITCDETGVIAGNAYYGAESVAEIGCDGVDTAADSAGGVPDSGPEGDGCASCDSDSDSDD